jgi:hypothetical protein
MSSTTMIPTSSEDTVSGIVEIVHTERLLQE